MKWYETKEAKEWIEKQEVALKEQFTKHQKEHPTHKIGNIYCKGGHYYLLCAVENSRMALINLMSGNRWSSLVEVSNLYQLTEDEFSRIGSLGTFKLIPGAKATINVENFNE